MAYTYYISTLILTVVGVVFWMYPPKKINGLYGYRTTRSCKSQEAWDFAQRYSAKLMTIFGLAALIVAAAAHLFRNRLCINLSVAVERPKRDCDLSTATLRLNERNPFVYF